MKVEGIANQVTRHSLTDKFDVQNLDEVISKNKLFQLDMIRQKQVDRFF